MPLSLNAQIRDAQQQVADRHRTVGACVLDLRRQVRARLAAGPTLMLAGSIGFIAAELARLLSSAVRAGGIRGASSALVKTVLHLTDWARIVFTALP